MCINYKSQFSIGSPHFWWVKSPFGFVWEQGNPKIHGLSPYFPLKELFDDVPHFQTGYRSHKITMFFLQSPFSYGFGCCFLTRRKRHASATQAPLSVSVSRRTITSSTPKTSSTCPLSQPSRRHDFHRESHWNVWLCLRFWIGVLLWLFFIGYWYGL